MHTRIITLAAAVAVAGLAVAPAHAATTKKVTKGSYTIATNPNPAIQATGELNDGCDQTVPGGADNHPFTVPGKGTLHLVLQGEDPVGQAVGPDWDLFLLDSDGSVLDSSTGTNAHEETTDKFKRGQKVTFQACNLTGLPSATVSWTFTPS